MLTPGHFQPVPAHYRVSRYYDHISPAMELKLFHEWLQQRRTQQHAQHGSGHGSGHAMPGTAELAGLAAQHGTSLAQMEQAHQLMQVGGRQVPCAAC